MLSILTYRTIYSSGTIPELFLFCCCHPARQGRLYKLGAGHPFSRRFVLHLGVRIPAEYLGSSQDNRLPMPLQGILPRSWFVLSEY